MFVIVLLPLFPYNSATFISQKVLYDDNRDNSSWINGLIKSLSDIAATNFDSKYLRTK